MMSSVPLSFSKFLHYCCSNGKQIYIINTGCAVQELIVQTRGVEMTMAVLHRHLAPLNRKYPGCSERFQPGPVCGWCHLQCGLELQKSQDRLRVSVSCSVGWRGGVSMISDAELNPWGLSAFICSFLTHFFQQYEQRSFRGHLSNLEDIFREENLLELPSTVWFSR